MWCRFLLAGCLLSASCAPDPADTWKPRLVLLYAPCTVNADYLAPYDAAVPYTPNLAALAERSVVFERHHTECGQSSLAYASILTGGQSDHHGVYTNPGQLDEDVYLMAEAYAAEGYETFLWLGHPSTPPRRGFAQGVDAENARAAGLRGDDPAFAEILGKLRDDPSYRAFVMTNFTVTHGPYGKGNLAPFLARYPEERDGVTDADLFGYVDLYRENHFSLSWNYPDAVERLALSPEDQGRLSAVVELLYKSNVHLLDQLFGVVMDRVEAHGLVDESLIIFTADHGEVMNRPTAKYRWSHSNQLAPEVLRVPFLVQAPILEPRRYAGVSRSMDLMPTMLALSGIALGTGHPVQGEDLSAAAAGRASPPDLRAPSHTSVLVASVFKQMYEGEHMRDWALVRSLVPAVDPELMWVASRDGDHFFKYAKLDPETWGVQAFDLASDPGETNDLFDPEKPAHQRMERELSAYKRGLVDAYTGPVRSVPGELDASSEELETLRSLGYVK